MNLQPVKGNIQTDACYISGITGGGGEGAGGQSAPQRLLTGNFFGWRIGKKEAREKGWKLRRKEKLWKGRWKIGIGSRKSSKKRWGPFFFFFFFFLFTLKMMEISSGSTKIGIFYREKAFHVGEKIRKNYFAPSEKYACYAPVLHHQ